MEVVKLPSSRSYKEEWKRKLVAKSPNRPKCDRSTVAMVAEFLRVCDYIKRKCHGLEVTMLVLHGGDDRISDPNSAKFVYESAVSEDKTPKIFEGMWHQFIGEPNESVELVFGTILSWIEERARGAKSNWNWLRAEM